MEVGVIWDQIKNTNKNIKLKQIEKKRFQILG